MKLRTNVCLVGALGVLACAVSPLALAQSQPGVISSDQFDIALVKDFDWVWDDRGSGARRDVTVLKPKPPAGFKILGHVAVAGYTKEGQVDTPYAIAIRPRKGHEHLIAAPTKYEWVYDDAGSGATADFAAYRAVCPERYVALGGIGHPGTTSNPGDPNFVCVSDRVKVKADWNAQSIWDDAGSGGKNDTAFWVSQYQGTRPKNHLIMAVNAFTPTQGRAPSADSAYAISFLFNDLPNPAGALTSEQSRSLPRPVLQGPSAALQGNPKPVVQSYRVPFFLVDDPRMDSVTQWAKSPYYTIERTVNYRLHKAHDNTSCAVQGSEGDTFSYTAETGMQEETNWAKSLGFSASVTASTDAKPLGVGGSVQATLEFNGSLGWGGSSTKSTSESTSMEHAVPKGTYSALYLMESTYRVLNQDREEVPGAANKFVDKEPIFVDWAPAGWSQSNPCGAATSLLAEAGQVFNRGQRYRSASGGHYLVFQNDGNLVVYSSDDRYVWGLDRTGVKLGNIHQVRLQDDGNLVAAAADGSTVWSALTVKAPGRGSVLHLDPDGVMEIIDRNGNRAWSSGD